MNILFFYFLDCFFKTTTHRIRARSAVLVVTVGYMYFFQKQQRAEHPNTRSSTRRVSVVVALVVVSHIRIGCQPEKLLYTVANPARGLLNREKGTKKIKKSLAAHPSPPPSTLLFQRKIKHKSRDASTGATQVSVRLASVQGFLRLID